MKARRASPHAELIFHLLACVPRASHASGVAAAASLHDAAYVAWATERGAPTNLIEEDAPVLSALLAEPRVASTISLLALLHDSLEDLAAHAAKPLDALEDAGALASLRALGSPAVEILRADAALGMRAFAQFFEAHVAPRLEAVRRAFEALPAKTSAPPWLDEGTTELSLALGVHGRVFGARVIVGAGHPAEPLVDAATRAHALASHERCVARAAQELSRRGHSTEWAWVEAASIAMERALARCGALPASHEAWLASLSLEGLAELPRELAAELTREVLGPT